MNPETYLLRVRDLRRRGLSDDLAHDLREAGDEGLLREVEALSDADIGRLNRVDQERREDWWPTPRGPRRGETSR